MSSIRLHQPAVLIAMASSLSLLLMLLQSLMPMRSEFITRLVWNLLVVVTGFACSSSRLVFMTSVLYSTTFNKSGFSFHHEVSGPIWTCALIDFGQHRSFSCPITRFMDFHLGSTTSSQVFSPPLAFSCCPTRFRDVFANRTLATFAD